MNKKKFHIQFRNSHKTSNLFILWNITDADVYTDIFVVMWYQKAHNLKEILKEYSDLSHLSSVMGAKGQPLTASVDEIAASNNLEPHYHHYPLIFF